MVALPAQLGRYEVLTPLGAGGMGEVYRAKDHRLDRHVAIKVLPQQFVPDPAWRARFEREARAIAALSHPNILAIYDYGIEQGIPFAVLELLEGETLRSCLSRSALNWQRALELGTAIADGLAAAHAKGIVHRDLKPENLFLTTDGLVKILDFGLARVLPLPGLEWETRPFSPDQTQPGVVLGTIGYMSPEQVRGLTVDARSDIFSLGCVLYEMVKGQRPFQRRTAADICAAILHDDPPPLAVPGSAIPGGVEQLIRRCLAKAADERFPSACDLSVALRAALTELAAPPARLPHAPAGNLGKAGRGSTDNEDAYRLYLAGRYYWDKRTEEGLRKSIVTYHQALDKDPSFALAWVGLAEAYHLLGVWGHAPPTSACPKGKGAALRSIELDESNGEAHCALGVNLKDYHWDFPGAARAFRRALELAPHQGLAHMWYGECLACMGRHSEAIAELRLAQDLDPLSTSISAALGRHGFFFARLYDQAADQLRKTIATDSAFWVAHNFLGWVCLFQGNCPEAFSAFQTASRLDDNPETLVGLGYAHAKFEQPAKALECLDALMELARRRYVAPINLALIYIGLGETDQAFTWLTRACDDHSQWLSEILVDPAFDPLRFDPRFTHLLRRMNGALLEHDPFETLPPGAQPGAASERPHD
jgi:tetratricopeptide (TPR) repeat protein